MRTSVNIASRSGRRSVSFSSSFSARTSRMSRFSLRMSYASSCAFEISPRTSSSIFAATAGE